MSKVNQLKKLIKLKTRHLYQRQQQAAKFGLNTPPEVAIDIEDLEAELTELQQQLIEAESNPQLTDDDRLNVAESSLSEAAQPGRVTINVGQGGSVNLGNLIGGDVGGDVIGGDKVAGDKVGRDKITTYSNNVLPNDLDVALTRWKEEIETTIADLTNLDEDDKAYLTKTASKVADEAQKGSATDPDKIEGFLTKMSNMAPDILEVTVAILKNPFAGVGLVLEKINDRIQVERQK